MQPVLGTDRQGMTAGRKGHAVTPHPGLPTQPAAAPPASSSAGLLRHRTGLASGALCPRGPPRSLRSACPQYRLALP